MGYNEDCTVKLQSYRGKAEIDYTEEEKLFRILIKTSNTPAGVAVGMMVGALGRMIMDGLTDRKEVASFHADDVLHADITQEKRKTVFVLQLKNSNVPAEIRLPNDIKMTMIMQQLFSGQRDSGDPGMGNLPLPPVTPQNQEACTISPPVDAMIQPAVQPAVKPVAQPPVQPAVRPSLQPPVQPQIQQPPVQPQVPQPPVQPQVPQPPVQPQAPRPPVQPQVRQPAQAYGNPQMQQPQQYVQPGGNPYGNPPRRPVNALLSLRSGAMAGRTFRCVPGSVVLLGRDPGRCNLPLPQYVNVSGVHCRLSVGDRCVMVQDMNSTNGTFVNGNRLVPNQQALLRNGDILKLAGDMCVFQISFEA